MSATDQPPWLWPRAAYIHVPFCAHHCSYCDFAVAANAEHRIELYLEALDIELATLGQPQPVETIFIGGGTPTHLGPKQLERLLTSIQHWFPGARSASKGITEPGCHAHGFAWACSSKDMPTQSRGHGAPESPLEMAREFSIESTPESLTDEKLALLRAGGVNRLSVGVQSFNDRTLAALDRRHSGAAAREALGRVRRQFDNWSLDLIFGVPGQSLADWQSDIETALTFEPPHVSTYGLTYEKGTPLWKEREHSRVQPLTEDDELAMYQFALDRLPSAGLLQEEISNHARPGHECRHNHTYWGNLAYFGFGVGAARYVEGRRELNSRSLETYLRRTLAGESAVIQSEQLTPFERARETLTLQLRRRIGIDRSAFATQTGHRLDDLAGERISALANLGLLRDDGRTLTLTRTGICVADSVIADLLVARASSL